MGVMRATPRFGPALPPLTQGEALIHGTPLPCPSGQMAQSGEGNCQRPLAKAVRPHTEDGSTFPFNPVSELKAASIMIDLPLPLEASDQSACSGSRAAEQCVRNSHFIFNSPSEEVSLLQLLFRLYPEFSP